MLLSVVMLSVIRSSVVAPIRTLKPKKIDGSYQTESSHPRRDDPVCPELAVVDVKKRFSFVTDPPAK